MLRAVPAQVKPSPFAEGLAGVHTWLLFDFAIIADFDNYKDYQIYATHPAHQEFTKRILRPLIKNRAAVQFLL